MNRAEATARIEGEYAIAREENAKALDWRILRARKACPQIGVLLDGMSRRFEESTRRVLQNRGEAASIAQKLRTESLRDRGEVRRLLALNGFAEDFLDQSYNCPICKDTGYADEAHIKRCACFDKRMLEIMSGEDNSYDCFERFDPAIYPSDAQRREGEAIRDICERYADSLPKVKRPNLVLMGKSGLGKTFFLDCIHTRATQRGLLSCRVTAFRMLEAMRAYHFGETGDDSQLNALLNAPLLLIDDIGTEPMLKNITNEYMFLLVNERLYSKKPTVYATNLTPKQLAERYSERVSSRLLGRSDGECVLLQGEDLRLRGIK